MHTDDINERQKFDDLLTNSDPYSTDEDDDYPNIVLPVRISAGTGLAKPRTPLSPHFINLMKWYKQNFNAGSADSVEKSTATNYMLWYAEYVVRDEGT